ncbi:MAG TPA: peptide deformylase [Acidimicrobiales bacterium]|nr:peptide deformylase [Acidimicrobiales bacterium]
MKTTLHDVRTFGDPILRLRCNEVDEFGDRAASLGRRLQEYLRQSGLGIGVAANQLGIGRQAFAYDMSYHEPEQHGVIFNPKVAEGDGVATYEEGCLSIPDFFYPVERPETVVVVGQDWEGEELVFEIDGLMSRLFQHEIDHLNGILMFDRIPKDEREQAIWDATHLSAPGYGRRRRASKSRRFSL